MDTKPGFNREELEILNKIHLDVREYQNIYEKGLELIEKEPHSKQLLTTILDDYLKRLDDLPPMDISLENVDEYDDEIKEKIKSLVLFGTQAVLIRQNSIMQKKLSETNQKYRDLLSVVTHEFKNSLTSIYGYNRIIKKRIEQKRTDGLLPLTESIDRLAKNLFAMVDTLLNMFLIEDGKLTVDRQLFDLVTEVIKPIVEEVEVQLKHRKMNVKINSSHEKNIFYGDLHLMQVVCRNLLLNAIQYGQEGADIEIDIISKANEIEIHFANYGNEIPEDQLPLIFNKFSRFHKKKGHSNVGLGLYTVKNIIEMHGGTIRVEAPENNRIEFIINLPNYYQTNRDSHE